MRLLTGTLLFLLSQQVFCKKTIVRNSSEITAAMLTAAPGDTLIMANGEWLNQKINFKGNGTSLLKIVLKAETNGQVFLTGNSTLKIGGSYLVVEGIVFKNGYSNSGDVIEFRASDKTLARNCRLTNSAIIDYNTAGTDSNKWISIYGQYNRVDHCYFKGKTNNGTTLVVWRTNAVADYHLIDSNYFGNRPLIREDNGGETIRVGTSTDSLTDSFTTVEYNFFEECNGETEIISNKSCGNIYRYNTFKDCQGILTLRHGNRCTVEGNFFFCGLKTNSGGIRIIGEDHTVINNYIENSYGTSYKSGITIMNGVPNSPLDRYFQVKRALVAFNTVVNSRITFNIGAGKSSELSLPPLDCKIVNNIFTSSYTPLITFTDTPINTTWSGNIFYSQNIGMPLPANNYNEDPKLEKGPDNIFRLSASSPAIDRSDNLFYSVTKDMDGQPRTGIYDVGADEYSTAPVLISPMSKDNTGPIWMRTAVSVVDKKPIPAKFTLMQNYPNPFNPDTRIKYFLNESANVTLKVYDSIGRLIKVIESKYKNRGMNEAVWNGTDNSGFTAKSGVYIFELSDGKMFQRIKGILLK